MFLSMAGGVCAPVAALLLLLCANILLRGVRGQCDGSTVRLTASSRHYQYLTSPGYPQPFVSDTDCTWLIDADSPTSSVDLDVIYMFMSGSRQCGQDSFLALYDDGVGQSEMARLCRDDVSFLDNATENFRSTDRFLFLRFRSQNNASVTLQRFGFFLRYTALGTALTTTSLEPPGHRDDAELSSIAFGTMVAVVFACTVVGFVCSRTRCALCPEAGGDNLIDSGSQPGSEGVDNVTIVLQEETLPPRYSDLSLDGYGGVSNSPGGGASQGGGDEASVDPPPRDPSQSTVSTLPPAYSASMLDTFPPDLPPQSQSECSIPPPTTGTPPPSPSVAERAGRSSPSPPSPDEAPVFFT